MKVKLGAVRIEGPIKLPKQDTPEYALKLFIRATDPEFIQSLAPGYVNIDSAEPPQPSKPNWIKYTRKMKPKK